MSSIFKLSFDQDCMTSTVVSPCGLHPHRTAGSSPSGIIDRTSRVSGTASVIGPSRQCSPQRQAMRRRFTQHRDDDDDGGEYQSSNDVVIGGL